jgi:hypothetical protein
MYSKTTSRTTSSAGVVGSSSYFSLAALSSCVE